MIRTDEKLVLHPVQQYPCYVQRTPLIRSLHRQHIFAIAVGVFQVDSLIQYFVLLLAHRAPL